MKARLRCGIPVLLVSLVLVSVAITLVEAASYNRWDAFSYALQWHNKVNPTYRYFGELDCANFVSQSLLAGGWPEAKHGYANMNSWYYDGDTRPLYSNTWAVANDIRQFIVNSARGRARSLAHHPWSKYFQVGDIVQIDGIPPDRPRDGVWDHTMIITRVRSGDNIWVTYHDGNEAGNKFYESLRDVMSKYPNSKFMGYHLYDSFSAAPKLNKRMIRKAETWANIKKK